MWLRVKKGGNVAQGEEGVMWLRVKKGGNVAQGEEEKCLEIKNS